MTALGGRTGRPATTGRAGLSLVLAGATLAAAGCSRREPGAAPVGGEDERRATIARVNGEAVPRGLFEAYLRDNVHLADDHERHPADATGTEGPGNDPNALSDEVKSRLLDRFLAERALLEQAGDAGVEASDEELDRFTRAIGLGPLESLHEGATITEREWLRRYLVDCYRVKRFLEEKVAAGPSASEEDARAHYQSHASRFAQPDRYRLRLIRVDSLEEARALRAQVLKGASFQDVSRTLADGAESDQGKDLGEWDADQLPAGVAAAIALLKPGQISEVIQDPDAGFNIYFLESRREGGTIPFEQVRDRLIRDLTREQRARRIAEYRQALAEKTRIDLDETALGFHYQPRSTAEAAEAAAAIPSPEPETPASPAQNPAPANGGAP